MAFKVKNVANERGFSLTELFAVMMIMGILFGIAGLAFRSMTVKYQVETQTREMLADMMSARVRANARNKASFVTITATTYQITEDTNESGGTAPDAGDVAFWPTPKQLHYQVLSGTPLTVIMDTKGITSTDGGAISIDPPAYGVPVHFDTAGTAPEYDCILLAPTRINMGKWDGTNCIAK